MVIPSIPLLSRLTPEPAGTLSFGKHIPLKGETEKGIRRTTPARAGYIRVKMIYTTLTKG